MALNNFQCNRLMPLHCKVFAAVTVVQCPLLVKVALTTTVFLCCRSSAVKEHAPDVSDKWVQVQSLVTLH